MIKWMVVICLLLPTLLQSTHGYAKKDESYYGEPAYAKWGQLAMTQVKNKYDADIVDYKHLGREKINSRITEENFKFWLRSSSREFGVFVKIRFEPSTDKVQSISMREV